MIYGARETTPPRADSSGINPLPYLRAYLNQCAQAGGTAPTGDAVTQFLPWTATTDHLTAWAHTRGDVRCADPHHTSPAPTQPTHQPTVANGLIALSAP